MIYLELKVLSSSKNLQEHNINNNKESNMKQLNKQQQKIVDTLFANLEHNFWSADFVRLPQNRTLIKLLNE